MDNGAALRFTAMTVAQDNPLTHPNWLNTTFIAWLIDPSFSGRPQCGAYFSLNSSDQYAGSLYDYYTGLSTPCPVRLSFDATSGYQAILPSSCLPGVTSFQWLAYSFCDTVPGDTTGADAFGKSLPDFHTAAAPFAGGVTAKASALHVPTGAPPVVHAPVPSAYWLVGANGAVYTFASAHFYGSVGDRHSPAPVVAMPATAASSGYWLVGPDGAVYAVGEARNYGRPLATELTSPVQGITASPDRRGYWLVTSQGHVYDFGDARSYPTTHPLALSGHGIGLQSTPDGKGYWTATTTEAIYTFGDARFYGSGPSRKLTGRAIGFQATPDGRGHWLATTRGRRICLWRRTLLRLHGARAPPLPHDRFRARLRRPRLPPRGQGRRGVRVRRRPRTTVPRAAAAWPNPWSGCRLPAEPTAQPSPRSSIDGRQVTRAAREPQDTYETHDTATQPCKARSRHPTARAHEHHVQRGPGAPFCGRHRCHTHHHSRCQHPGYARTPSGAGQPLLLTSPMSQTQTPLRT